MPRVYLSKEERQAARVIRSLPRNVDVARRLNESRQTIGYRKKNVYQKMLEEALILLDLAGYEIKEKGE